LDYKFTPLNAAYPTTPRQNSQNATTLKFDNSSTMEALDAALASLELSDSINYVYASMAWICASGKEKKGRERTRFMPF
jgi:hypothetical protein